MLRCTEATFDDGVFNEKERQNLELLRVLSNINYYNALVEKSAYLKEEGQRVLDKMFGSSLKNFVTALYDGKGLNLPEKELQSAGYRICLS